MNHISHLTNKNTHNSRTQQEHNQWILELLNVAQKDVFLKILVDFKLYNSNKDTFCSYNYTYVEAACNTRTFSSTSNLL